MIQKEQTTWLHERFQQAGTTQDLRELLHAMIGLEHQGYSDENLDFIRSDVFRSLTRLTAGRSDDVHYHLLNELLPLCLRRREEWPAKDSGWRYREILRDWLNALSGHDRSRVREKVIEALLSSLQTDRVLSACYTIGEVKYRNSALAAALESIALTPSDPFIGDVALWTRIALGVESEYREKLLAEIHSRMPARWNRPLIGALKEIADQTSLNPLFTYWLIPERFGPSLQGEQMLLALFAIQVPGKIAERAPTDQELQDEVWNRIWQLREFAIELLDSRFCLGDELAHPCDSPSVVRAIMSFLKPAQSDNMRHLLYLRLQEFVKSRQLSGWLSGFPEGVQDLVFQDFRKPTRMLGIDWTIEYAVKLGALNTMLSTRIRVPIAFLDDALANERSGFAIRDILDHAACFDIDPLPQIVVDLLAARFGQLPNEGNHRLSAHIAAIHVAHASRSPTAFQSLLHFEQPWDRGGVLISLIEALADTASALITAGDDSIFMQLWQTTQPGVFPHRRVAAAAAFASMIRRHLVPVSMAEQVWQLVQEGDFDPFARKELLSALGDFPCGTLPPRILQELRESLVTSTFASTIPPNLTQEWRDIALGVLARHRILAQNEMLITTLLGLVPGPQGWELPASGASIPASAFVLGTLYTEDSSGFTPAIASMIRTGMPLAIAQLSPFLKVTGTNTPHALIDALVDRILIAQTDRSGEPGLLGLLAHLDPERLVLEPWHNFLNWLPHVRAAFANTLGFARIESPQALSRRRDFLLKLMGDGLYGVRRAAYRAFARTDSHTLRSLCNSWARDLDHPGSSPMIEVTELRQRAAEAGQWLDDPGNVDEFRVLAIDPEPTVRESWMRCAAERQDRLLATLYLETIRAVQDEDGLFDAWRIGRALEQVGDDETEEELAFLAQESARAVGLRHWLRRIAKKVGERWKKVTERWPEPWFSCRGNLEEVHGTFTYPNGSGGAFHGWLWQLLSSTPTDFSSWGGWIDQPLPNANEIVLQIQGRNQARALVSRTTLFTGPSYLTGTGAYPEVNGQGISQEG